MIRKLAALAGAGALLLGAAVPVFATGWSWGSSDVAIVNNGASAYADTGGNSQDVMAQKGGDIDDANGSRYINTGSATAYAGALTVANTHVGCGPCASGGWGHKDFAMVNNGAEAMALTGYNSQDVMAQKGGSINDADGDRTVYTGAADSTARAWTIVNTHWGY